VALLHLDKQQRGKTNPGCFAFLADHYIEHELGKKAETSQSLHKGIIRRYLNPRFGKQAALVVTPLEIEDFLEELKERGLANPTRSKIRAVMGRVYRHSQKHGLISRDEGVNPINFVTCESSSEYEPITITPKQATEMLADFAPLQKALTLLICSSGLRISEALGLVWSAVDWTNHCIHIRQRWIGGKVRVPKTGASKKPIPMNAALEMILREWRKASPYHKDTDWMFASAKMRGRQPLCGSQIAQDHLRRSAERLGIIPVNDPRRFGFHSLRHSLATWLVSVGKEDPSTVQKLLRHRNISTTLGYYSHAGMDARLAAQTKMTRAMGF
jgi:integrase